MVRYVSQNHKMCRKSTTTTWPSNVRNEMSFTRPVLHAERQTVYEDDTRSGQVLEEMHKVVVCEENMLIY